MKKSDIIKWTYQPYNNLERPWYPKKLLISELSTGDWVVQMDKKELKTNFERALRACVYIVKAKDAEVNFWSDFWFKRRIKSIINCT